MRVLMAILMVTLFTLSYGKKTVYDERCHCEEIKKEKLFSFCNSLARMGKFSEVIRDYKISKETAISTCQSHVKSELDKENCEKLVGKFKKCDLKPPKMIKDE